jgi:aminopeptidase N
MLTTALLFSLQLSAPLAVVDDTIRVEQDVVDYDIAVFIPDRGESIRATTHIRYVVNGIAGPLVLNFDEALTVDSVLLHDGSLASRGSDWEWELVPGAEPDFVVVHQWGAVGDTLSVTLHYNGRPADGLVIRDNVHNRRTAFADNWPDRARHWFPCEDHPSDKATVSFAVNVPHTWRAVANGRLVGVDSLAAGRTVWHWREARPIPVHTMVIGAGHMAVTPIGEVNGVPQSVWTFPQDSAFAVEQPFRRATQIVAVLDSLIGPFPFDKLAHVQSSTRYGGMENSSAIFYAEAAYSTRRMGEGLVAHETAHQWFGDAVAQYDWHHLWLSEGFATYFGPLFYELIGETETFESAMQSNKRRYLGSDVVERPVIDTTVQDPFDLLNANNYQKGAWVLHMLRSELGDSLFFAAIREYYAVYRDSSVLTSHLSQVVSRHAGRPMEWFFQQWLLQPGYPELEVVWDFQPQSGIATVEVRQTQPPGWGVFRIKLPLQFEFADGTSERVNLAVVGREHRRSIQIGQRPTRVVLDPDGTVLARVVRLEQQRASDLPP